MQRIKLLKDGEISEATIHKTAIQWARAHPIIHRRIIHIPNEGKRTGRYGNHLKSLGLLPGVWDLFVMLARHGFHGAWIEIKSKHGTLSPAQKLFGEEQRQEGYFTAVCYSVDEVIRTLDWYCLKQS